MSAEAASGDERSRGGWRLIALLLVPALVLRFGWLEWMEFAGDEEYFLLRSWRALHEGFAYWYPTSAGLRVPSFFVYLISLPLLVTQDPVLVAAFVGLLNAGGVALLFVLGRHVLGARAGLLLAVFFACAPWAILHSRKIWNSNVIFPFAVALHLVVLSNASSYRRWKVVLACVLYGILAQIHPSTWFLALPILLFHVAFRIRIRARDLALGAGAAALFWAPYAVWLLRTRFDNVIHAVYARSRTAQPPDADPLSLVAGHLSRPLELASGANFQAGSDMEQYALFLENPLARAGDAFAWLLWTLSGVAVAWAFASTARSIARARRGEARTAREQGLGLMALVVASAYVLFPITGQTPNEHYHVSLWPAVPLMLVAGLERACERLGARGGLATAAVALVAVVQLGFGAAWQHHLVTDDRDTAYRWRLYAHRRAQLDESLPRALDAATKLEELRLEREAALASRFESSDEVLLRLDGTRDDQGLRGRDGVEAIATPRGTIVRRGTPREFVELPEFEFPDDGAALFELELSAPDENLMLVFWRTRSQPEYSARRVVEVPIPAGRGTVHFAIDDPEAEGAVALRLEAWSWTLHRLEVRRIGRADG